MFDGIAKFEVQVKPEDLDELNHVNNVVYMRWMEMAAREGSALAGWPTERYFKEGLGAWVVRKHWIEYLRDCKLGDTVEVYTWVQEFSASTSLRPSCPNRLHPAFRLCLLMICALRSSALLALFAIYPRQCEQPMRLDAKRRDYLKFFT